MTFAIVCDFDGTITLEDTGKKLLSSLATEDWRYYDQLVIEGKMGTREALLKQYNLINDINEQKLRKIVDSIKIDPTFFRFYQWTKEKGILFEIVSDGFEKNIKKILKNNGLDPNEFIIKANNFDIKNDKIEIEFLTKKCEHGCANCKYSHVNKLKSKGYKVVYIGDGLSDILPARELADYIFAKKGGDLERNLQTMENVRVFEDFNEVLTKLEELLKKIKFKK